MSLIKMNGNTRTIKRFEIWTVSLDPTVGSEISKSRPCLVISTNEMNNNLNTILAAPITHTVKNYPTRISIVLKQQNSEIALDQMRAVDQMRFIQKVTTLSGIEAHLVCDRLKEMFEF
jgi:mRNA interferase MazF